MRSTEEVSTLCVRQAGSDKGGLHVGGGRCARIDKPLPKGVCKALCRKKTKNVDFSDLNKLSVRLCESECAFRQRKSSGTDPYRTGYQTLRRALGLSSK